MKPTIRRYIIIAVVVALFVLGGVGVLGFWMANTVLTYDSNPPPPEGTPSAYNWQVDAPIRQVEFHPNGKTLAVLQEAGELTLHSIPAGIVQSRLELSKSLDAIPLKVPPTHVPASPTATMMITGTVQGVEPLQTPDKSQLGKPFHEIWGAMEFSPDGSILAASSQQLIHTCFDSYFYPNDPNSCPRGVSGTWRVTSALWRVDPGTGELGSLNLNRVLTATSFLGYYETTRSEPVPTSFSFSPDSHTLAVGNADGSVLLWDVETGNLLRSLPGTPSWVGLLYQIKAMAWSMDGATLYTGDYDEVMRELDVATGELKRTSSHSDEHSRGHSTYVMGYTFSSDGQLEATASWAYEIAVFNKGSGDLVKTIGSREGPAHLSTIMSLGFSPNSRLIASGGSMGCADSGCGSDDPSVRVWRVADGAQLALYSGHTSPVLALSWSPDGRSIASGSDDGSVKLWDVSTLR